MASRERSESIQNWPQCVNSAYLFVPKRKIEICAHPEIPTESNIIYFDGVIFADFSQKHYRDGCTKCPLFKMRSGLELDTFNSSQ